MSKEQAGTRSNKASAPVKRGFGVRRNASLTLALAVMFGSLTACGLTGPTTEGPTRVEESATAPEEAPTQAEEPGSGTESAGDPGTEPNGGEQDSAKELAEEAAKVYMEYQKLETEMLTRDKTVGEPPWLKKYAAGDFYTTMLAQIDKNSEAAFRFEGNAAEKTATRGRSHQSPKDTESQVSLEVCADMTKVDVLEKDSGKLLRKASGVYRVVKMKRIDGSFKIIRSKSKAVSKCPF